MANKNSLRMDGFIQSRIPIAGLGAVCQKSKTVDDKADERDWRQSAMFLDIHINLRKHIL